MSGKIESRFSITLRAVSLTVAILFSVQNLLAAAPTVPSARKSFPEISIPEEMGRIEDSYFPGDAPTDTPLIIHIRDAHAQPEAQRNIQAILDLLSKEHKIQIVAAEAAFGPIDASILKFFPDEKSNLAMAEDLVESGEVNGIELFALQSDAKVKLQGVENPELYRKSLEIFARIKKSKQEIAKTLQPYRTELESLETRFLNSDLRQYLIKKRSWEQNQDISLDYFRYLQTLAHKNLQLDLNDARAQFEWPQMVRLMKTAEMEASLDRERSVSETLKLASAFDQVSSGDSGYFSAGLRQLVSRDPGVNFRLWMLAHPHKGVRTVRHFFEALWRESRKQEFSLLQYPSVLSMGGALILREEIDPSELFLEVQKLESRLEANIVRTEQERNIFSLSSDLTLVSRALALELARHDYLAFQARFERMAPDVFRGRFEALSGRKRSLPLLSADLLKNASEFYRISVFRDSTLIENTLQAAKGETSVLVAGGFHSEGLLQILKDRHVPYISIIPKMSSLADESLYERAMVGSGELEFSPLGANTLGIQFLSQPASVYQNIPGAPSQSARLLRGLLTSGVKALASEGRESSEIYRMVSEAVSARPDLFGNQARVILREEVPVQLAAGKKSVDVLYLDIPSIGLRTQLTIRNGSFYQVNPLIRFDEAASVAVSSARSEVRISRRKFIFGASTVILTAGIFGGVYEFNRRAEIAKQEEIDAARVRYFKVNVPVRYTPDYDAPKQFTADELRSLQKDVLKKVGQSLGAEFDADQIAHMRALADFYGLRQSIGDGMGVSPVMNEGDIQWWIRFSSNRKKISRWTSEQENETLALQFFWRWQTREVMEHFGVLSHHQGDVSAIAEATDIARSIEPAIDALFIKATRNNQEIPAFIRNRRLRSEVRATRSPEELYVISEIVRLVSALDARGLRAKIHGRDLLEFGGHGEALVSFIQRYSVLKNLDDIRRVLSWRLDLESKSGLPLNGMDAAKTAEKTRLVYESIFDPTAFLKHWAERIAGESLPLNILFFRRAQSGAEITNLLKSLPNVNIQIVLSATDDGLGWYEAARQFRATGVPGAGKALLDLAQDFYAKDFLAFRLSGEGKSDDEFTRDFTALVLKLHAPHDANLVLSDEMKIIFQKAMRMNIEKRRAVADYLEIFLEEVQRRHRENADFTFRLKNIPLRSLVLLGASMKFQKDGDLSYWQKAVDAAAALLDVKPGNRVIFPTRERQHLLAVREDGTVYFSETGINRYGYEPSFLGTTTESSFLGLWLVRETVDTAFIESFKSRLSTEGIMLEDIPEDVLPAEISQEDRPEVTATTKRVQPGQAARVAELFSEMSTTAVSAESANLVPVSSEADAAIRSADVVFYTTASFETNVGAALIVPGVEDAINQNRKAAKIALAEVNGGNGRNLPLLALNNIERYLSHSPMGDLTNVQDHADFVLAGLLGGQDPRNVVSLLAETEQASGGLVSAVALDARTDETHGFYGSPVLSEAMIALVGLKAAGFRVSDTGGLLPDARALDTASRVNNQAGLFRKNQPVASLIREIKTNFPRIVKKGAFAFDVDMTLLPKNSNELTDYPELAYLLMRMLREGVTVSIISGNSFEEQGERILEAIKREMKDDFSALENLVFYVSGGATRFNINKNGEVVPDVEYNRSHELNLDVLKNGVNQALRELAAKNFSLNADQLAAFISETQKKNGSHVTFPWKDGGAWEPEWLTPAEVKARKEKKQPLAFPWVEVRGDFMTPGGIVASITVKPMQVFEHDGDKIDLRDEFQALLRASLSGNQGDFVIRSGGTSSTDITTKTANKNVALKNLIASRSLDEKWVFYFGDEFYQRQVAVSSGKVTQLGNDEAIALDPELSAVRTLAVNSTDMKGASAKTIWIGRSPQATQEFLEAVVINPAEIFKRSELRAMSRRELMGFVFGAVVAAGFLASGKAQESKTLKPANPKATPAVAKLLTYFENLPAQKEKRVVVGQFIGHPSGAITKAYDEHITTVEKTTGKKIAMVGVDYGRLDDGGKAEFAKTNQILIAHSKNGGLATVSWHARNPWTGKNTRDYDRKGGKFTDIITKGNPAYTNWMKQLDETADALTQLQREGVTVLWRPLHESNGKTFWWTRDVASEDFVKVWRHMFDYFTNVKKLNNLVWVYSVIPGRRDTKTEDANYPGDKYVDMTGIDAYMPNLDEIKDGYDRLTKLGKPFMLSEFGPFKASDTKDKPELKNPHYDYADLLKEIRAKYPKITAIQAWNREWSLGGQKNAKGLLEDPWAVNRGDLPKLRSEARVMSETDFIAFFDRAQKSGAVESAVVDFSGGQKEVAFQVVSTGDVLRSQARAVVIQKDTLGYTTLSVRYANPTFWDNRYVLAEANLGKNFDMAGASPVIARVVTSLKEDKSADAAVASARSEMRALHEFIYESKEPAQSRTWKIEAISFKNSPYNDESFENAIRSYLDQQGGPAGILKDTPSSFDPKDTWGSFDIDSRYTVQVRPGQSNPNYEIVFDVTAFLGTALATVSIKPFEAQERTALAQPEQNEVPTSTALRLDRRSEARVEKEAPGSIAVEQVMGPYVLRVTKAGENAPSAFVALYAKGSDDKPQGEMLAGDRTRGGFGDMSTAEIAAYFARRLSGVLNNPLYYFSGYVRDYGQYMLNNSYDKVHALADLNSLFAVKVIKNNGPKDGSVIVQLLEKDKNGVPVFGEKPVHVLLEYQSGFSELTVEKIADVLRQAAQTAKSGGITLQNVKELGPVFEAEISRLSPRAKLTFARSEVRSDFYVGVDALNNQKAIRLGTAENLDQLSSVIAGIIKDKRTKEIFTSANALGLPASPAERTSDLSQLNWSLMANQADVVFDVNLFSRAMSLIKSRDLNREVEFYSIDIAEYSATVKGETVAGKMVLITAHPKTNSSGVTAPLNPTRPQLAARSEVRSESEKYAFSESENAPAFESFVWPQFPQPKNAPWTPSRENVTFSNEGLLVAKLNIPSAVIRQVPAGGNTGPTLKTIIEKSLRNIGYVPDDYTISINWDNSDPGYKVEINFKRLILKSRSETRALPVVSIQRLPADQQLRALKDFRERVLREIEQKGSGDLVSVVTLSDPHADMSRFDPLVLEAIRRMFPEGTIPADFKLDKKRPLFEQLAPFGVTPEKLIGRIFYHNNGDIPDRGSDAIKVGNRSEELIDANLSDFIIGNHDLWMFLNLWGFHLPWYEGFSFYDYSDAYDQADIAMKVQNLIRNAHEKMPETRGEGAKIWWAKRLAEYIEYYARLQKKEWGVRFEEKVNGTIDPLDPEKKKRLPGTGIFAQIDELFKEDKGRKKEEQKYKKHRDLWSQLRGRNISDTEIYTGVRAVGTVSVQWWRDLLESFKSVEKSEGFDAEPENLRTAWAQAIAMMENEIIPEVAKFLDQKLKERDEDNPGGKWWWRVFEAINYKNYTSVEWWAKDWSSHKDWGTAVIDEINRDIEEENAQLDPAERKPLLTQANYLQHPAIQKMAQFFRKNFNLYTRDIYQNVYLHAFLPVDPKTGEFFFKYRNIEYRGKGNPEKGIPSVWEGLNRIGEDVRNPALSPLDLYEALNLVNSWYADNTTIAKATHVISAVKTFGLDRLSEVNGFYRLFMGHIPLTDYLKQVKPGETSVITGFNTGNRLFDSDLGAAAKFGGRGGGIITGAQGVNLYGYTHKDSQVIVDNPDTLSDDGSKVLFKNKGIERDEFLTNLADELRIEIERLEKSLPGSVEGDKEDSSPRSEARGVLQKVEVEVPKATEPMVIFRQIPELQTADAAQVLKFIQDHHLTATVQYEGGSELELDNVSRDFERNWKIGGDRKGIVRLRYFPISEDRQTLKKGVFSLTDALIYALEADHSDQGVAPFKVKREPTVEEPVTSRELSEFLEHLNVNLVYKNADEEQDTEAGWYFEISRKEEDLLFGQVTVGPFTGELSEEAAERASQGDVMLVYEILDRRNILDDSEVAEVGPDILSIFRQISRSELRVDAEFAATVLAGQGRFIEDLLAVAETSTDRVFAQSDIELVGTGFIQVQYGWDGELTSLSSEFGKTYKASVPSVNSAVYSNARTVVLRGDTSMTAEDLQAMDLQPGSRVVVIDEIGGPSLLWNRYANIKLPNNVRIERRSVLDALAYNEVKKVFAENPVSVPVLVLPSGTPDSMLESYQSAAPRKGLVIASPRSADARRAMAWVVRLDADKLRQQIPDGLTFRFHSDALSPTSVQPGAENRFAKFMLSVVSSQRIQTAA